MLLVTLWATGGTAQSCNAISRACWQIKLFWSQVNKIDRCNDDNNKRFLVDGLVFWPPWLPSRNLLAYCLCTTGQVTGRLPPLPRCVYLHSQPRITCHSAVTIHPFPPIAWLCWTRGRELDLNRIESGKQDVRDRRVSQRTGNTETCQTEQEGEMEGGRRGRKSRREEEESWNNRTDGVMKPEMKQNKEKLQLWSPLLDRRWFVVIMTWLDKQW